MTLGKQIGQRLTALMNERNLNNKQLAEKLAKLREGSTVEGFRSQIINWKDGRIPDEQNAALLGEALGVDAGEFRPAMATQAQYDRATSQQKGAVRAQMHSEIDDAASRLDALDGRGSQRLPEAPAP